ncbi:MAG: hypothetical protein R3F30_04605 [Planctomycetota bacterium]
MDDMTRLKPGLVLFRGRTPALDDELWSTGGTAGTTGLVKDINPWTFGPVTEDDRVMYVVGLNGRVLFSATDGVNGQELWSSDGTGPGTFMVRDINPGPGGSNPGCLVRLGNDILFSADDGISGTELWISDGTVTGTRLVMDIFPGGAGSIPINLARVGDRVYFTAYTTSSGNELWVTDGTTAGTRQIADIEAGAFGSFPGGFTALGDKVAFTARTSTSGAELYVTDGTAAGTVMVVDLEPGRNSGEPGYLCVLGSKLYFSASPIATGSELYVSDGTSAGTKLVKDLNPGIMGSAPRNLCVRNGRLWFTALDTATGKPGLWSSDGTAAGTRVEGPTPANLVPTYMTPAGSRRLYIYGTTGLGDREPGTVDTTTTPPAIRFFDLNPVGDSSPYLVQDRQDGFVTEDGWVWFTAQWQPLIRSQDRQLWRIENGGTAQIQGQAPRSPFLDATDPLINTRMTIVGSTSQPNPVQILLLGTPSRLPARSLGSWFYIDPLMPVSCSVSPSGPA